jgi:GTPase-associated system helical domain
VATDILIRFLGAGLINVGGDDAKLEKLQETSGDLSESLKQTPSKAASFSLIAFDPEAPENDPVIKEAVQALQNRWPTYVNTFASTPIVVIRAVLLDALTKAAVDDDNIGLAFVTSARNVLPLMEAGNEVGIWAEAVKEIERQVNIRAEADWSTPESISVTALKYSAPAAIKISQQSVKVDRQALTSKIAAASGPNNASQATQGNPYWPHNQPQQWVTEFSTRMAEAIGGIIENVALETKIAPIDLSTTLKDLSSAVSKHVDETLKAVSAATAGLQRRTNLIWWKETLYSPSIQISYREMPCSVAAALMAFDLSQQVPTFSPSSVAAFLHEAVLNLPSCEADKEWPLTNLVREALEADQLTPLREAAKQLITETTGRGPILGILLHGNNLPALDDEKFRALVGVPAVTLLTVPQWATWIFRELQAARASQDINGTKKRGHKS